MTSTNNFIKKSVRTYIGSSVSDSVYNSIFKSISDSISDSVGDPAWKSVKTLHISKSVRLPVYNSIRNVKPWVHQKLEDYDFTS
jgi:hypothetical protein